MVWGASMRERLLTQHFLQRFLENDLLSPDADHHDAIAMVCGGLLTLGLGLPLAMACTGALLATSLLCRAAGMRSR